MRAGRIVESGRTDDLLSRAAGGVHPAAAPLGARAGPMTGLKPRHLIRHIAASRTAETEKPPHDDRSPRRTTRRCPGLDRAAARGSCSGTMTFGDTVDVDTAAHDGRHGARRRHHLASTPPTGMPAGAARRCSAEILARPPRRRDDRHQGRHPPRRRRRRTAALGRGAARPRSRAACAGCGTDHVDLYYLHQPDRSVAARRDRLRPGRARRRGQGPRPRRLQLRGLADRRRLHAPATRSARRARSSRSSSTTSSPAGSRRSTLEFATTQGSRDHGLQPARRRPAHRQHSFDASRRPRAASATPRSPPCTSSATGTPSCSRSSRPSAPSRRRPASPSPSCRCAGC